MASGEQGKKKRRGGTRRKTGCFTCKSRHARCDEKKPVCSNCERLNLQCRPSEFIAPSSWTVTVDNPAASQPTNVSDQRPPSPPASTFDVFNPRFLDPDLETTPSSNSHPSIPTPDQQQTTPTSGSITSEMVYLLQTFFQGTAKWMDIFDHSCTYQRALARRIPQSALLLHCTCAYESKHLSLMPANEIWAPVASRYYGESLRMLIDLLGSSAPQDDALTATILLSSYELIAATGQEHRRHVSGAMMLIKTHGISAKTTGIDRANFWIYVRHDIAVALATESPLLLCPSEWGVEWAEGEVEEDVLGNLLLWLLARAINVTYGDKDVEEASTERTQLLMDGERWFSGLPEMFHGIKYGENIEGGFSRVYFSIPAAATAMIWYHIMYILLYAEPVMQGSSHGSQVQYHANEVLSIAMSDIPDAVRTFANHGLYYAAKHIHGVAKKAKLWTVMEDIEIRLGYHTRSRVKKLQDMVDQ